MKKLFPHSLLVALVLVLGACGSGGSDEAGSENPDQSTKPAKSAEVDYVERLREIPTMQKITELTARTDSNNLLGRPNGYSAATVFHDKNGDCAQGDPGVDCGATLEVWPDAEAAKKRSRYILSILEEAPMFGSEWHHMEGGYLLRVSGVLTPKQAEAYEDAFAG